MSKLDELIKELCPEGVEYKELQEVLVIKNGSDYKSFGSGKYPVYGSGGIMTYIDRYVYDKPTVLIPRKGSIDKLYYVDTPFWNVDTIFYTEINDSIILPRYLYHCLLREHLEKLNTAGGVPSLTQKVLNKVKLPVPPLEVQREIVRILDSFTLLTAELTAELTARKKQYEYYRNQLLTRDYKITKVSLNNVAVSIASGKNKERADEGRFPVFGSTGIISKTNNAVYNYEQILIARVGANAGYVHIANGQYDVSDNTLIVDVKKEYVLKYIYYILVNMNLNQYAKGGGQPLITASDLKKLIIPIPAYEIQKRIVDVLDNFDKICTDINIGLPAEIEARQKQYEFYRDQLLTFAESGNSILTRQDKTRQDKTRQDKTRQDKTRQDKTRQDKTRQDKT